MDPENSTGAGPLKLYRHRETGTTNQTNPRFERKLDPGSQTRSKTLSLSHLGERNMLNQMGSILQWGKTISSSRLLGYGLDGGLPPRPSDLPNEHSKGQNQPTNNLSPRTQNKTI